MLSIICMPVRVTWFDEQWQNLILLTSSHGFFLKFFSVMSTNKRCKCCTLWLLVLIVYTVYSGGSLPIESFLVVS